MSSTKNDLRRKLRAADKRRRRRSAPTGPLSPAHSSGVDSPDVAGLIVETLVQAATSDRALIDSAAVAALRGCLRVKQPTGVHAAALFNQIEAIGSRDDVSARDFRVAVKNLLETATQHQESSDETSFLSYLKLIAS